MSSLHCITVCMEYYILVPWNCFVVNGLFSTFYRVFLKLVANWGPFFSPLYLLQCQEQQETFSTSTDN